VTLVDAVEKVTPALAVQAAACNDAGRLADESWSLLHECGILRSLQPARFGGGEESFVDFVEAVRLLSTAAPAAGWVAGVIGVHPWQLALFDERTQQEMWANDPSRMHSSSYNPTGRATPVDGGYEVSGRWSFSSGSDHCSAVNLGAAVPSERGGRELRSLILFDDQYVIEDKWDVAGLRGTGSKDIVVESAFVPTYRTQSHLDYALGEPLPGWQLNSSPLYRLPWSVVFNIALAASVVGAARGYVEVWIAEAGDRRLPGAVALADDPLTQRRLAEADYALTTAELRLRSTAAELAERAHADDTPTMDERGRYRWSINRACEMVSQQVSELHRAASGRVIFRDHPLHGWFNDVQSGMGHTFLLSDPVARAVGGQLLGTSNPEMIL